MKAAAIFEATMTSEQAGRLAELMNQHVSTRPAEVDLATLLVDGDTVQLIAYWSSPEVLEEYRRTASVLRGTALMREVGVEPSSVKVVKVPQFA